MDDPSQAIDAYSDPLMPLREAVRRYLKYPSMITKDGVIHVGHRPWIAPLAYMFRLYPGIEQDSLERYCKSFRISIPEIYSKVLSKLNGTFSFGMSLCGVPRSMLGKPALLDRSALQCHDLATAVNQWAREYRVPDHYFHFGGRHFSWSANVGYFIDGEQRILCVRNSGKIIGEWTRFSDFLKDELKASEDLEEKLHPWQEAI